MASVHNKGGSGGQTNFEIQDLHATAFLTPPQVTGHIYRRNSFGESEIEVDTGLEFARLSGNDSTSQTPSHPLWPQRCNVSQKEFGLEEILLRIFLTM